MKVVCVNNHDNKGQKIFGLTVGKTYVVLKEFSGELGYSSKTQNLYGMDSYLIEDDNKQPIWHYGDNLVSIKEHRELKLKELGI